MREEGERLSVKEERSGGELGSVMAQPRRKM